MRRQIHRTGTNAEKGMDIDMANILYKEFRLAALPLTYFFIAAALLAFVPGYPILLGAFFVTLGIFYSFQIMRENGDIAYSMLLPIAKSDVVKGKFAFTAAIELCGFVIMTAVTLVRMTWLSDAAVYTSNALMGANLTFLGYALTLFGVFNLVFVGGFFKTAYYYGKPFVFYSIAAFVIITAAESLRYFPNTETLYSLSFDGVIPQAVFLICGAVLGIGLTVLAVRLSVTRFGKTDL